MLTIASAHIQVSVVVFFEIFGCCGEHEYTGRQFGKSNIIKGKVVVGDGVYDVGSDQANDFFIKGELHNVGGICRGENSNQAFLTYNAFPESTGCTFQAHGFDFGAQCKFSWID